MSTFTNHDTKVTNNSKPPRPKRLCFSFAAYANNLIDCLKSSNVVVSEGLSDTEFSYLESNFNFSFPPDLRDILKQGLPISPGFPNWRSSSAQQLHILLNLPTRSILRRLSKTRFWHPSWGPRPNDPAHAFDTVRRILREAPPLVPIYQHCYIPSTPNIAGNPVFYVDHDGNVSMVSFDVIAFFREAEFIYEAVDREPAWAATTARRIEFWSEMSDGDGGEGWWWWSEIKGELGGCLEGVLRSLREGGWKEEEIREMMMMMDGGDQKENNNNNNNNTFLLKDEEDVALHVSVMSLMLLRAGWTMEDVVYSLGDVGDQANSWLEFHDQQQTTITIDINDVHDM